MIARAVFRLDRWLCKWQDIEEYSGNPECLFRVEPARADCTLSLRDGTHIREGDPVLKLHIWNEHMPPMGRHGPDVAWARRARRAVDSSLRELAACFDQRPDWRDIRALCGDMRLASRRDNDQLLRIATRFGFETGAGPDFDRTPALRRAGETILGCMLVLAANPAALRATTLSRECVRVYLSRRALQSRYRN